MHIFLLLFSLTKIEHEEFFLEVFSKRIHSRMLSTVTTSLHNQGVTYLVWLNPPVA